MSNVNSLTLIIRKHIARIIILFHSLKGEVRASTAISGGLRFSVYSFTVTFKVDTFRSVTTGQCINVRHTESSCLRPLKLWPKLTRPTF
ncbi:hypothetical protein ABKN59_002094 [Abortiporus biennis]